MSKNCEDERLYNAIIEAMDELKNASMGGIGEDGPTLQQLDDHVEKTGRDFADNADYHTMQRVWRILDDALNASSKEASGE